MFKRVIMCCKTSEMASLITSDHMSSDIFVIVHHSMMLIYPTDIVLIIVTTDNVAHASVMPRWWITRHYTLKPDSLSLKMSSHTCNILFLQMCITATPIIAAYQT